MNEHQKLNIKIIFVIYLIIVGLIFGASYLHKKRTKTEFQHKCNSYCIQSAEKAELSDMEITIPKFCECICLDASDRFNTNDTNNIADITISEELVSTCIDRSK